MMLRHAEFILFGTRPHAFSLKGIYLLVGYFFGALLVAAILSPLCYWGIIFWGEVYPNGLNSYLAEKEFGRYFDRLRWLVVILFLPWFVRRSGIKSWSKLGLNFEIASGKVVLAWLCLGVGLLAMIALVQALVYHTEYQSFDNILGILGKGLCAGFVVALVEEAVFRGIVLRIFYTALSPFIAVFLSSLFFAFVHFKQLPQEIASPEGTVTVLSGFLAAFWTVFSIIHTFDAIPFLNLTLVGMVLGLLFLRSRSLWPCVGLHAGWVSFISVYDDLVVSQGGVIQFFLGSSRMLDGLSSAILLGFISFLFLRLPIKKFDY
ncbi:MAG: hypothetical protein DF168_00163 [Candidatus Moanabacter tarae]|uniref:CAAX prenyl protease 2/Lysostaphin resistance protein A-like domain-containing protein n=1 Tax=Candidatus Moanibacter tarae TaxID=2200854 RepID=A0A2Z4AB79_9BACT|nr:MAG: hypothetical protein DF168_00163 [Candidatus Moanabacter tarae]|tara:strand:+ start:129022 stop:129978 length:957 start_codon:yes stop_codon:yes gene_type:complete